MIGRSSRALFAFAVLPLLVLNVPGCSGPVAAPDLGVSRQPVVYGEDGRREYFEVADPTLRLLTEQATVALMPKSAIPNPAVRGALDGPAFRDRVELCEGEPFAEQPSLALCTGVLVSDDLVLTAGHCLGAVPCDQMALVLGFYYEATGQLHPIGSDDVMECAEVVVSEVGATDAADELDYAWIRLRKPRGLAAAVIDSRRAAIGADEVVHSVSFGGGIPAKIEIGAHVWDARAGSLDYFVSSLDNLHGGSGAAVYGSDYRVIGIAARGQPDFWLTDAGCRRSVHEAETAAGEEITYAYRALDGLCRALDDGHVLCAGRGSTTDASCSVHRGSRSSAAPGWALVLLAACSSWRRRSRACCGRQNLEASGR
jgi:hypothetical protein